MGEMADLTIEQGMAEDDYRADNPYEFEDENCDMPPSDYHGRYHGRRRTAGGGPRNKPNKTCKHCNKDGFIWKLLNTGWRLVDSKGVIHNCLTKSRPNIPRKPIQKSIDFRNDPKIKKALKNFQNQLANDQKRRYR